jgi:hypothetical protein
MNVKRAPRFFLFENSVIKMIDNKLSAPIPIPKNKRQIERVPNTVRPGMRSVLNAERTVIKVIITISSPYNFRRPKWSARVPNIK